MNRSKKSHSTMLEWQYRTLIAELSHVTMHASDDSCPCNQVDLNPPEYCLGKHLLNISSLASETALMDESHAGMLEELSVEALEHHQKAKTIYCKGGEWPDLAQWSRNWRKKIEPLYYVCSTKAKLKEPITAALAVAIPEPIPAKPTAPEVTIETIKSDLKNELMRRAEAGEKLPVGVQGTERTISRHIEGMSERLLRDWHSTIFPKLTPTAPAAIPKAITAKPPVTPGDTTSIKISGKCETDDIDSCTFRIRKVGAVIRAQGQKELADAIEQAADRVRKARAMEQISGGKFTREYSYIVWIEDRGHRLDNKILVLPKGGDQETILRETGRGKFLWIDKRQVAALKTGREVTIGGIPFYSTAVKKAFEEMPLVRLNEKVKMERVQVAEKHLPKSIDVYQNTIEKHYIAKESCQAKTFRVLKPGLDVLTYICCAKGDALRGGRCHPNPTIHKTIVPRTEKYENDLRQLHRDYPEISITYHKAEGVEAREPLTQSKPVVGEEHSVDIPLTCAGSRSVSPELAKALAESEETGD